MLHALKLIGPNNFVLTGYDIKLNEEKKIERDVKMMIEGNLNEVALYLVFENQTPWKDLQMAVAYLEKNTEHEASFGIFGGWVV